MDNMCINETTFIDNNKNGNVSYFGCNIPMIRICEIDIGNLKTRNFTKLVQVRNFITFLSLKVFRHEE